jgi:prefoldin subunit 5
MTDNGTLRDHMFNVIQETNELLRQVEVLNAQIEELTKQLSALWKVDND